MLLKDGGLYETKQGKRYRVRYDPDVDDFVCPSFGGSWDETGYADRKVGMDGKRKRPHLVHEIFEERWVPISDKDICELSPEIRTNGKHLQMRVDRETARYIASVGNEKVRNKKRLMPKEKTPDFTSDYGTVETVDQDGFKVSFDWTFGRGNKTYLTIETSNGVTISIPL